MKKLLLFAALLCSISVNAQNRNVPLKGNRVFIVGLTTGTDLVHFPSIVGGEVGSYGLKSRHSYVATLEVEGMTHDALGMFGKSIDRNRYINGLLCPSVGGKYFFRLFPFKRLALHAIAGSSYYFTMGIFSPHAGLRGTFSIDGALTHVEYNQDVINGRKSLRFSVSIHRRK